MFNSFVLGRGLDYKDLINTFVILEDSGLAQYELSTLEWQAIETIEKWLLAFRGATTMMSSTHRPTISSCYAIIRGLQDNLTNQLSVLPTSTPAVLRNGLIDAHTKLSSYHYLLSESPYYLWACCEYYHSPFYHLFT